MTEIDISKPVSEGGWGIVEGNNKALQNTCAFLTNFKALEDFDGPVKLHLPAGTYKFNTLFFIGQDDIEFYGDTDASGEPTTTIKFKALDKGEGRHCKDLDENYADRKWHAGHVHLDIRDTDNFNIHDLVFDGIEGGDFEGGVWVRNGSTNGMLKNLEIRDAYAVSCVIEGQGTHHVTVEDCTVYGQRHWSGSAKAMFLAGGYAHDITFKNCTTYSQSPNNNDFYSPADHYGSDNATNVEYHNCVADGSTDDSTITDDDKGTGFWNEANESTDQETSSTYYGCTAIQTAGGLAASENSDVKAYDFYFDNCSAFGWAARCQGTNANLEIYNSTFDGCYSTGGYLEGGVHFSTGSGVVEDCTFINNPSQGYNVSFYTSDPNGSVTVTLEHNTFDRGARSHGVSKGAGHIHAVDNILAPDAELIQDGSYNWLTSGTEFLKEATTTAVNSPTASTKVAVVYQSHTTIVQYDSGESLVSMLVKMRDALNADADALITAEVNYSNYTITFIQKDPASSGNLVTVFLQSSLAWANGDPFNPMTPAMS